MERKIEVYTVDLDGCNERKRNSRSDGWKWLFVKILDIVLCIAHAVLTLAYDLTIFMLLYIVSIYSSRILVYITCHLLSFLVDARSIYSLLEVEVSAIVLVFIVAEIQPELERRWRPGWVPTASSLTEFIVNFCYIMAASASVPVLVLAFQSRFCDNSFDALSLNGPFEAFMVILQSCGFECTSLSYWEFPWDDFQERAPFLLSLCLLNAGNFVTKLYVKGKEQGVHVLLTCTCLMCKLICPMRWAPDELRLDAVTVKYFFFGLIHELVMFFALMFFPTVILVDMWTFFQDSPSAVNGNWLFGLMILGFPAVYFASYIDECTLNTIAVGSKNEPRTIFEKRRLGLVQGGLTCDLVVCLACLIGTLCHFYCDAPLDVCRAATDWEASSRLVLNLSSHTVQCFIICLAFLVYASVKMLVVCDWVLDEDDSDTELLLSEVDQQKPEEAVYLLQNGATGLTQEQNIKTYLVAPCGIHV